jgi:hypothetical protein
MSKPRRKRKRPFSRLPKVGRYVLSYQDQDGKMHDPPIPLDQRLTDDELRELVEAVQAKVQQRIVNRADEPPSGIKLETHYPDPSNPPADQMTAHSGTVGVEPKDIGAALARSPAYSGPPISEEEIDRVLAGNGIAPAEPSSPIPAANRKAATPAPVAGDSWGDAAGLLVYRGLCLFTGASLCGAGVIVGGWLTLKALPCLQAILFAS